MGVHTGVYVVYYLYRSRYSFVVDHFMQDGHHRVDLNSLDKALTFPSERLAKCFITDELAQTENSSYFVSELTLGELLEYFPEMYEVRRAALTGGAA